MEQTDLKQASCRRISTQTLSYKLFNPMILCLRMAIRVSGEWRRFLTAWLKFPQSGQRWFTTGRKDRLWPPRMGKFSQGGGIIHQPDGASEPPANLIPLNLSESPALHADPEGSDRAPADTRLAGTAFAFPLSNARFSASQQFFHTIPLGPRLCYDVVHPISFLTSVTEFPPP
jgi:hypothetical protein